MKLSHELFEVSFGSLYLKIMMIFAEPTLCDVHYLHEYWIDSNIEHYAGIVEEIVFLPGLVKI